MAKAAAVTMFFVGCLAACCVSPQTDQAIPQEPLVANQYSESAQPIEARVGGQFTIVLYANPSTGYTWEAEFDEGFLELVSSEFRQAAAKPGTVGVGGEQRFTFHGLKAGTTEITFIHKRPWEQGFAERKVFTVHLKE